MKTIFVDLGGTFILNNNGQAILNQELFNTLKKYKDHLNLVILSDTEYDVTQILNDFSITELFHPLVITKHLYPINKRDPETYLFACKKAGVLPADCLLIDNEPDFILAANQANVTTLLLNDPDFESKFLNFL